MNPQPGLWAIMPLKQLEHAKQRLSDVLSPEERRLLMLAMARDVLGALSRCPSLAGVLIVSRTSEADALAQTFGVERFAESADADLSGALTQAARHLADHWGATGVLVIPADVPLVDAPALEALLAAHRTITLVPDDERLGTNALISSPWNRIPFLFDGRSFAPHLAAARAADVEPVISEPSELTLDVDVPDDLRAVIRRGNRTQTGTFLNKSGIADRLASNHNHPSPLP